MPPSRQSVRNLLAPGWHQAGGDRGIAFTHDEEEACIDAYLTEGGDAVGALMKSFKALPLVKQNEQRRLAPLRSVSTAYRQAQIPAHLRKGPTHDGRKSTQKAARRTPQPPDPRGNGGAQAGGGNPFNRAIAIYSAQQAAGVAQYQAYQNSLVAFQGNSYLNQLGAQNSQNHNPYSAGLFAHTGVVSALLGAGGLFSVAPGGVVNIPIGHAITSTMAMPVDDGLYKTPLPVEIRPGEIVAWRCWRCEGAGFRSMAMDAEWSLDKPMEGKPSVSMAEGVHAWKTRAQAEKYAQDCSYLGCAISIGTIELWGEVIEHEEGYRAQFGQIKEIVETRAAQTGPSNPYLPVLRPSVGNYVHAVYAPDSGANGPYSSWERAFGLRPVGAPMDEREGPVKVIAMCALVACMLALLVFGFR